ncbi:MAG: alpha/beta hydrolase, partial [Erysipelotrichaceae bacterium]|nr:alpha/beta hydrolase [Erysipelotrichaceae bacterium]
TKDESIVDWYLNEPRCTFMFTLNGYYNMFKGISRLYDPNLINAVPKDLPVLFVSGADDPVGSFGAEVEKAVKSLRDAGMRNVSMHLYEGDRHEILNETDREQVYEDLLGWMNELIK